MAAIYKARNSRVNIPYNFNENGVKRAAKEHKKCRAPHGKKMCARLNLVQPLSAIQYLYLPFEGRYQCGKISKTNNVRKAEFSSAVKRDTICREASSPE